MQGAARGPWDMREQLDRVSASIRCKISTSMCFVIFVMHDPWGEVFDVIGVNELMVDMFEPLCKGDFYVHLIVHIGGSSIARDF